MKTLGIITLAAVLSMGCGSSGITVDTENRSAVVAAQSVKSLMDRVAFLNRAGKVSDEQAIELIQKLLDANKLARKIETMLDNGMAVDGEQREYVDMITAVQELLLEVAE